MIQNNHFSSFSVGKKEFFFKKRHDLLSGIAHGKGLRKAACRSATIFRRWRENKADRQKSCQT